MPVDIKSIYKATFDVGADAAPGSYFEATKDGRKIYYRIWKPTGVIKAQAFFFHGLGEHIERYDYVFSRFADAGIMVKGMDWRGHGRTVKSDKSGIQGFHTSFAQVHEDMLQLLAIEVEGAPKDLPTFSMGHSMGGLIALLMAKHHSARIPNLRGVISQSPACAPGVAPSPILIGAVRNFGFIAPKVTQPNALDLENICSQEAVIVDYLKDSLNHGLIAVKLVQELYTANDELKRDASEFKFPIIIRHNENDRLTSNPASKAFFDKIASEDKSFFAYPAELKLGHELHNEPSIKNALVDEYIAWILERSK
ncbi:hypothetical protein HDU98_002134 [Podochytrium sp. JEL0797]|nr:hypothetical protein HDU98_002134 [Podochytrium sp. JEL0797]